MNSVIFSEVCYTYGTHVRTTTYFNYEKHNCMNLNLILDCLYANFINRSDIDLVESYNLAVNYVLRNIFKKLEVLICENINIRELVDCVYVVSDDSFDFENTHLQSGNLQVTKIKENHFNVYVDFAYSVDINYPNFDEYHLILDLHVITFGNTFRNEIYFFSNKAIVSKHEKYYAYSICIYNGVQNWNCRSVDISPSMSRDIVVYEKVINLLKNYVHECNFYELVNLQLKYPPHAFFDYEMTISNNAKITFTDNKNISEVKYTCGNRCCAHIVTKYVKLYKAIKTADVYYYDCLFVFKN